MVEARQAIRAIMTTDAPLLFTPGQIALAVMQHVVASRLSIDPSLQTKLERHPDSYLHADLFKICTVKACHVAGTRKFGYCNGQTKCTTYFGKNSSRSDYC